MPKSPGPSCIYLDHHATTPMDPRVFEKMVPFFTHHFGNPSSAHHPFGWRAQEAINNARIAIAESINAHPTEIIFTSGATEATNLAIKGLFLPEKTIDSKYIISSTIEHSATLSSIRALEILGIESKLIKPNALGLITPESLESALTQKPALISLFVANHELGTVNNIKYLGEIIKKNNILFHVDATQALGKININCQELPIDMMSFSGHKIYGPKGVGALYIRREIIHHVCPLIHGGGQEYCKRSGTLNVPAIVGFGEAVRLAVEEMPQERPRIASLRDRLLNNLSSLDNIYINGCITNRVAGNLNISFGGIDGEELILSICNQIAVSTGSACASSSTISSPVLRELGIDPELRQATLRFGVGRFNTSEEIDLASELIIKHVKAQRESKKFIKITRSKQ